MTVSHTRQNCVDNGNLKRQGQTIAHIGKKYLPIAAAAVLLAAALTVGSLARKPVNPSPVSRNTAATASEAATADETLDDMRGVWVTYMDLSMEYESDKSEAAFRSKFAEIADACADFGFNTLVVQVRPFCDALYKSALYPASHILSGEQGKDAGYDALKIMCETCRSRGLKIHAWVNPYRVTANDVPKKLSSDNPYVKNPGICLECESGVVLDPSSEEARRMIEDGVEEIVKNYDIDGVQFDDYFYPPDTGDADSESYREYAEAAKGEVMPLADWRRNNVNLLIAETYIRIHSASPSVVFGISPQGNLKNNDMLSADVINWCGKRGFIDYICPQLYFSPDNPRLGFEEALDEWQQLDFAAGVRMYVGLAGYKAGSDADEGTWLDGGEILASEYRMLKNSDRVSGFMLYSYASLCDGDAEYEIENLKKSLTDQASSASQ